jgi:hypothetical protein
MAGDCRSLEGSLAYEISNRCVEENEDEQKGKDTVTCLRPDQADTWQA